MIKHEMTENERQYLILDLVRWAKDIIVHNPGWHNSARCFYEFFNDHAYQNDPEIYKSAVFAIEIGAATFQSLLDSARFDYLNGFIRRATEMDYELSDWSPRNGWVCEISPTKFCQYHYQEGEYCIHCGNPSERK